ncbi:MAG: M20 family metallo-hydrolase [Rikenellaceae bacterium]
MTNKNKEKFIFLLQKMIKTPSFSRDEEGTADIIEAFFSENNIKIERENNNIWAYNEFFDENKPTILLNSHHDTVKPNKDYTRDPFGAEIENGILYGLGSNDAGASGVSLIATFLHFYDKKDLKYNLCIAITAEEEVSGKNGVESILSKLKNIEFGIVGEPTLMQMAIAERGLVVLDCEATGKSGHAARNEGENAIYKAIKDINWFETYEFDKKSDFFDNVKMSVTVINAGTTHNVVPASCTFIVDVRVTEQYTNEEIVEIVRKNVTSSVTPRSVRLRPSFISKEHPIVKSGSDLGLSCYGSPTISDQSLMPFPTLKIGVGDSKRSHTADEFVYLQEIYDGIDIYINLLNGVL